MWFCVFSTSLSVQTTWFLFSLAATSPIQSTLFLCCQRVVIASMDNWFITHPNWYCAQTMSTGQRCCNSICDCGTDADTRRELSALLRLSQPSGRRCAGTPASVFRRAPAEMSRRSRLSASQLTTWPMPYKDTRNILMYWYARL